MTLCESTFEILIHKESYFLAKMFYSDNLLLSVLARRCKESAVAVADVYKRQLCDSAVFCALQDQLARIGRHAQLTRCFSAVAVLLVLLLCRNLKIG